MITLKWLIPFSLLFLFSGCSSLVGDWRAPPVVQVVKLSIPSTMLACPPEPSVPPDTATQADMADWAVHEKAVSLECRSRLEEIKKLQASDNATK